MREEPYLQPATLDEAVEQYEGPLKVHVCSYAEAFPGVTVTDA